MGQFPRHTAVQLFTKQTFQELLFLSILKEKFSSSYQRQAKSLQTKKDLFFT